MPLNYAKIIEDLFSIKNKKGQVVPYLLNTPQDKYLIDLITHYGKELRGGRDIILKARKLGFSSLILAIFAADFLLEDYPVASVMIANTQGESKALFERAKFFLSSALAKKGQVLEDICDTTNATQLTNKTNGATFRTGTAGSRTALRVESVQNLHFSEAAHFIDTDVMTARETIEGALQMVDQGIGRVFIESTANGYGNYFQILENKAYHHDSIFRSVFYGSRELYSEEWLKQKEKGFTTREMFLQEFPYTRDDAYMASGSRFFDTEGVRHLQQMQRPPMKTGYINNMGEFI